MKNFYSYQFIGSLLISITIILPYVYSFPHIFINAHDNLDIDVIRYYLVARKEYLFSKNDTIIPEMMSGLPRSVFDSEWYYPVWLFYLFHPYIAVILNMVIVHLVAFWSSFFLGSYLLKENLKKSKSLLILVVLISLIFSYQQEQHLLNLGLGIAASPILLLCLIRIIYGSNNFLNYLIIFLFPFVSRLTHTGFFWLFIIFIYLIFSLIKNKKVNWPITRAFILMIMGYLIVEYRLIWNLFFQKFQSHRYEFNLIQMNLNETLKKSFEYFIWGDYQARSMNYTWLILSAVLLFLIFYKKIKIYKIEKKELLAGIGIFVLSVVFGSFAKYKGLYFILKYINAFDLSRFSFLLPVISLYLVYLILKILSNDNYIFNHKFLLVYVYFVIFSSLGITIKYNHTFKDFVKKFGSFGKPEVNNENYFYLDEFYAEDIFNQIKKILPTNYSEYRVGSVGLHPSLSLFNGFYTIDGAIANYPLQYKKRFRKIIEKEIERDEGLKHYFDEYGCRVYLFTKEIWNRRYSNLLEKSIRPKYNTQELKKMNCMYIFSAYKIENADSLQWSLLNYYKNKNYIIYVYKIL